MKKLLVLVSILVFVSSSQAVVYVSEDCNDLSSVSPTFSSSNMAETSLVATGGPDGSQCVQTVTRFAPDPDQADIAWNFGAVSVGPTDFVRFKNAASGLASNPMNYEVNLKLGGTYETIPMPDVVQAPGTWPTWTQKSFGLCQSGQLSAVQVKATGGGDLIYRMDDFEVVSGYNKPLANSDFSQNPASVASQWNPYNYTYVTDFGHSDNTSMSAAGVAGGWFYYTGEYSEVGEGYTLAVDVYREDDWDAGYNINMGFIDTGDATTGSFMQSFYAEDIPAGEWTTLYTTWSAISEGFMKPAAGAFAGGKNVWFDNFRLYSTVPEPTTMGLLMAGGIVSLIRKRKK